MRRKKSGVAIGLIALLLLTYLVGDWAARYKWLVNFAQAREFEDETALAKQETEFLLEEVKELCRSHGPGSGYCRLSLPLKAAITALKQGNIRGPFGALFRLGLFQKMVVESATTVPPILPSEQAASLILEDEAIIQRLLIAGAPNRSRVGDPEAAIATLEDFVGSLDLPRGQAAGLLGNLDAVRADLADGDEMAATSALGTFVSKVIRDTISPTRPLGDEVGALLIGKAVDLILALMLPNQAPVAEAGVDQRVRVGTEVKLDARESYDPDGDLLTYRWALTSQPSGAGGTLSDPGALRPFFHANVEGTYEVELVVSDGKESDRDVVRVVVSSGNSLPVADAGADQHVRVGTEVMLDGSRSHDADEDGLTFRWAIGSKPPGSAAQLDDPAAPRPKITADRVGVYALDLVVNDGVGNSAPDRAFVTASSLNAEPVADAGEDQAPAPGVQVCLHGSGTDADEYPLTFRWVLTSRPPESALTSNDIVGTDSATPCFTPDVVGPFVFHLVVNDGIIDSDPDPVVISSNRPPVADAGPDQTVAPGGTVTLDGSGSTDPDQGPSPLSFLWSFSSVPAGSALTHITDPTSPAASFIPDVGGDYVVQLVVSDGLVESSPDTAMIHVAFCGDGKVNQPSEACDGSDDAACPGRCQADCTCLVQCAPPTITSVGPLSGPVGTEVTIEGTNLDCGATRTLTCNDIQAIITSVSPSIIKTFIPLGAEDCRFSLTTTGGAATAPEGSQFDVVLSRDFALTAAPAESTVIQGNSTSFRVSASGTNGFSELITLDVTGLPPGVFGMFSPRTITAGQTAQLIVFAVDEAPVVSTSFRITGTARVDTFEVTRSASANLSVAEKGRTTLVGRVLDTDGQPIKGVAIRVAVKTAFTDDNGNFLLVDPPAGEQTVLIDGATASTPETPYPTIPTNVTIVAGQANELPYVPHLHVQKNSNFTPITPTRDTIATDPEMPDVALRIPAGTQIVGWDGEPNEKVSMRTVPIGSLPVQPPPPEVSAKTVYMFYFGKQGGGTATRPIPFVASNDLGLDPGEKADLWYYDESPVPGEAPNDWRIAGTGTVSADGKTIVTDLGVGIPKFCCGAALWNPRRGSSQQGGETPQEGQGASGGDPVDLSTGIFMFTATDVVLPGRIPVAITRTYRSGDSAPGPFGIGTTMSYDDFLQQTSPEILTYVYRGNARTQFFRQADGSYITTTVPAFRGARITVSTDGTRTLRYKDGSALVFDPRGLPIRIRDRNGNTVVIKREVEFNPTQIIEPSGRALKVTWQILARDRATSLTDPIGRMVRYEYDGQNRLTAVTNPAGGVTRYTYDAKHRMVSITDSRGIPYLRNTYDVNSRVCEQEQADAGRFKFYYVTSDQSTLPESMQLLNEAAAGGAIMIPPCSAQPTIGIVVATVVIDPQGHPTTYRFNGAGYVVSVTNALGQTTKMELEDGTNLLLSITDAIARTTRFGYDSFSNVETITDPANNIHQFKYEPSFNRVAKFTDPLGNVTSLEYDARGNVIAITDPEQNLKPEADRLKTRFTYNQFGQPVAVVDPLGNSTTFTYDAHGNHATITDSIGNTVRRTYDLVSQLTSETDPRGRTTSFTYDKLSRITEILNALKANTKFVYDNNGNLLSVTDALNHTTTYEYNGMDRLMRRTDPMQAFETFQYDLAGNLVSHTDRKGQLSTFEYDALNRRIGASYADSATSSFVYDTAGRLVQAMDSTGGTILNKYNFTDQLISQITGLGTINYQFDALGRTTRMDVPGQEAVRYVYDVASRLTQIMQGTNIVEFGYDSLGRRIHLSLPNGVSTDYEYDAASRIMTSGYNSAFGGLGNLTYTYDPLGNRTKAGGSFARTLLSDRISPGLYDSSDRQVQFGEAQMTFDANGNCISIVDPNGVTTFTWDARNRLVGLSGPGMMASFTYDALGRRIARQVNGRVIQYLYNGLDIVQEVSNGILANSLRSLNIDELLARNGAEYPLADPLGSSIALTGPMGTVQTEFTYTPFGETAHSGAASSNPFQFTSRENDGTGLYYYRYRYYSPKLQRFISEDSIGRGASLPASENLYAYAGNNPINFIDPLGLTRARPCVWVECLVRNRARTELYMENVFGPYSEESERVLQEALDLGSPVVTRRAARIVRETVPNVIVSVSLGASLEAGPIKIGGNAVKFTYDVMRQQSYVKGPSGSVGAGPAAVNYEEGELSGSLGPVTVKPSGGFSLKTPASWFPLRFTISFEPYQAGEGR